MKIAELVEAITPIGATTSPQPMGAAQPQVTGNTQQLASPAMQAAQLNQQKQEKDKQKQQIAADIKAKQAELQALQKQQMELNKTV